MSSSSGEWTMAESRQCWDWWQSTEERLVLLERGPCYCEELHWIPLLEVKDEWQWTVAAVVIHQNRWWAEKWVSGYMGWWNECLVSSVDSWGSSGETLRLWMWKYKERMKKEHGWLYCVNRVDYGHGGSPEAGLCKLNRQERWRQLQEWTEMMRNIWRLGDWLEQCFRSNIIQFFVVTKYTAFILLFRCHLEVDFDMEQREGEYCAQDRPSHVLMLVLFSWMLVWSQYPHSTCLSLFVQGTTKNLSPTWWQLSQKRHNQQIASAVVPGIYIRYCLSSHGRGWWCSVHQDHCYHPYSRRMRRSHKHRHYHQCPLTLFSWLWSFLRHSLLQDTSPSTTISYLICPHQVICSWLWTWYHWIVSPCTE
jgi:hypothetical protein